METDFLEAFLQLVDEELDVVGLPETDLDVYVSFYYSRFENHRMGVAVRPVALVTAVVIFTAAMMLSVDAPTVNVISGLFGAVLPVLLIYVVVLSSSES